MKLYKNMDKINKLLRLNFYLLPKYYYDIIINKFNKNLSVEIKLKLNYVR